MSALAVIGLATALGGATPSAAQTQYRGLFPPTCRNPQEQGAVIGAIVGGALGVVAGGKHERALGLIFGAAGGGFVGAQVARKITKCDLDLATTLVLRAAKTDESVFATSPQGFVIESVPAPQASADPGCKSEVVRIRDTNIVNTVRVCRAPDGTMTVRGDN